MKKISSLVGSILGEKRGGKSRKRGVIYRMQCPLVAPPKPTATTGGERCDNGEERTKVLYRPNDERGKKIKKEAVDEKSG